MSSQACRICGDTEPSHVHGHNGRRIEDYFAVGRGETEMDAARRWKARALRAERAHEELTHYLRMPHTNIGEPCGIDVCIVCLAEATVAEVIAKRRT